VPFSSHNWYFAKICSIIEEMNEENYYQAQNIEPKKKSRWRRFWLFWLLAILLAALTYGSFVFYKVYSVSKKVNIENTENQPSFLDTAKSLITKDEINLKNSNERINILLLGIAGKGRAGTNLTDTIMVASLNLKTNQMALTSIPRDLHVTIPKSKIQTKINSVYQIGIGENGNDQREGAKEVVTTVEEILDQPIHYFVILNFAGFEKIINSLGGINIMNERDIYDASYPGPNYSYETFELKKGFHRLDGATALKYVRERHDDPEGDFGRAKRQQQVMQSTKNKIFSPETMLNVFAINDLLNALGENIITNISSDEIKSFYNLTKKLDTQNINNVVIDAWNKTSLLKVSHVFYGNIRAFVLVPRVGNWSEIQELSANIFDLNKIKRRKLEIANENASLGILNRSDDTQVAGKIQKLLNENFGYKNVSILKELKTTSTEKTLVYDATDSAKPFTLDEIAKKLPAQVSYEKFSTSLTSAEKPDLIIVIGKDLVSKYNMEEDTLQDLNNERDAQNFVNYIKK